MIAVKSVVQEKNVNSHLFINFIFAFFPVSFVLGSLFINLNLLLFCCLGIFYLRTKILTFKFDLTIKIIFLFFLAVFFSTVLNLIRSIYFEDHDGINLSKLFKSILFFRFFLFLTIVYLLSRLNILRFKYFFLVATFSTILLSLDIIYQHFFGADILGFKSEKFRSNGFFADEYIAGGYLLRFGFFTIFFTVFSLKNMNYIKFISTVIIICALGFAILFSGNRMPFILFLFGLFLILLFNFKIKKILLTGLITFFIILQLMLSFDATFKKNFTNEYTSFYNNVTNTLLYLFYSEKLENSRKTSLKNKPKKKNSFCFEFFKDVDCDLLIRTKRADIEYYLGGEKNSDIEKSFGQKTTFLSREKTSNYRKLFLAALYTWKEHKIFGNGIRSFYTDCHNLSNSDVNIAEDEDPNKKNLSCSNHPHNYYFQILTSTGIVGLFIILLIGLLFVIFSLKNLKFMKKFDMESVILLSTTISFFLEIFPLRSSGSLYTTSNATYIILVGSILLSYKEFLKTK